MCIPRRMVMDGNTMMVKGGDGRIVFSLCVLLLLILICCCWCTVRYTDGRYQQGQNAWHRVWPERAEKHEPTTKVSSDGALWISLHIPSSSSSFSSSLTSSSSFSHCPSTTSTTSRIALLTAGPSRQEKGPPATSERADVQPLRPDYDSSQAPRRDSAISIEGDHHRRNVPWRSIDYAAHWGMREKERHLSCERVWYLNMRGRGRSQSRRPSCP